MTSAMQMVALRETPTLQCTRVAVPFLRPRSIKFSSAGLHDCAFSSGHGEHRLTYEFEASFKLLREGVYPIVLYPLDYADVLGAPPL
jgi:hypothetical protein